MFSFRLAILFAIFAMNYCLAAGPNDFPDPIDAISGNVSSSVIVIPENPGVYLEPAIVEYNNVNKFEASVSVSELSNVICISPETSPECYCKIIENFEPQGVNLAQFQCEFRPPVSGTYQINLESSKKMAWGNFSVIMRPGEAPIIEQKIPQNQFGEMIFAIIFLGMIVCSYLFYFFYKLVNRKRDALNKVYEERQKTEDDMKVLRYRFFKREIDVNTYNSVFQQKEKELADINDKIVALIKSKKGAMKTPASE
ncbi:hypothetical protein HY989_02665 [Candidatus Micrarchaeota archaeon]|nr:hypothetical protein [Candidatus Micrarchaeota archaeon]